VIPDAEAVAEAISRAGDLRRTGEPKQALAVIAEALALWRGPALAAADPSPTVGRATALRAAASSTRNSGDFGQARELGEQAMAMSAYLTPAAIKLGASTLVYGYLNPPHAGTTAYLQRRSGTTWVAVTTGKQTANGKYAFSIKPTARGSYTYRVVWLAAADHQGTRTASKVLTVS